MTLDNETPGSHNPYWCDLVVISLQIQEEKDVTASRYLSRQHFATNT